MALDWAVDPLAFNAFFPAHVTDTAGTDPEVTALLDAPALPEVIGPPECIAPEVIAPPECIAPEVIAPPECIAPEVIAPPECIAPEVIAPPECIAPEVIALLADALGALLGAAALEALLGEALLLLPHAASNATHTVMTPAAMLVLFKLTWFSSEEIS